jgi:quercetin dioxygenase-like cupin family protein
MISCGDMRDAWMVASAQRGARCDDNVASIRERAMSNVFSKYGSWAVGAVLLAAAAVNATSAAHAADTHADATIRQVRSEALPNVPGKNLTAVLVTYPPGGKSGKHHHAGSVFAYVISGAIRSRVSDQGPARVYQAGESFFEPPGSEHLVSENASATQSASLLAVFVADDGAKLTTPDR